MSPSTKPSAADARKAYKTTRADLTVKILPNMKLDEKGDYAILKLVATRLVPNMVPQKDGTIKDESFNVHDVIFLSGSPEWCYVGKDKVKTALAPNTEVSFKGNARLDRGFAKMKPGESVFIEYLGKVDVGNGRTANDYNFDLIA